MAQRLLTKRKDAPPKRKRKFALPCGICWKVALVVQTVLMVNVFHLVYQLHVMETPEFKMAFQNVRAKVEDEAGLILEHIEDEAEDIIEGIEAEAAGLMEDIEVEGEMLLESLEGKRSFSQSLGDHRRSARVRKRANVVSTVVVAPGGSDLKKSLLLQLSKETDRLNALKKQYGSSKSCRMNEKDEMHFNGDFCPETGTITYVNRLPFERLVCDNVVPPEGSIRLGKRCDQPPRVFGKIPNRHGNMKPIELSFRTAGRKGKPFKCDIPCLSHGEPSIIDERFVAPIDNGDPLRFVFSMEGPLYYANLVIDENAYKGRRYHSTTSFKSEVPLPYFSWHDFEIHSPKPADFDQAIKGASFLARNCNSLNHRESVVETLAKQFRVDSLSSCVHNAQPPPGANMNDKKQTMSFYLFHLAFENQCYEDYITEKLWGPFTAGTIPVYLGSPNAKDHAPNNSLIMVDDFGSISELAKYLNMVATNRTLYEFHHRWRKEPLPPHFHAKYDFTEIHSTCRTCRWAYSKFYGLGWNHYNQSLRELATPRYPCVSKEGYLVHPVSESWLSSSGKSLASTFGGNLVEEKCYTEESTELSDNVLEIDTRLRRKIWQVDGAIDMLIESAEGTGQNFTLHFDLPLPGNDKVRAMEVEPGHVRIQNGATRYTLLTWPRMGVTLKTNQPGAVAEFPILDEPSFLPLRIRILVEDVDTLRKGADLEENLFGDMMKRDFFTPVDSLVK